MRSRAKTLPVPVLEGDRCSQTDGSDERCERTGTAVVRTLGARETALGPTVGGAIDIEEGILLLETEPRDGVLGEVHDLLGVVTVVGHVGGAVVVVSLSEDEDVVAAAEWIFEDGGGAEVDIGIAARGLVGGGTVKVPDAELADVRDFFGDSLGTTGEMRSPNEQMKKINARSSLNGDRHRHQSRHL